MHAPVQRRRRRYKVYKPTQHDRELVMSLVAARMTLPEIASVLDVSRTCLCDHFVSELATGRARRKAEVVDQLRKAARGGNVTAMRTLLDLFSDPLESGSNLGQKQRRELAARTAGDGTDWGDDLKPQGPVTDEFENMEK